MKQKQTLGLAAILTAVAILLPANAFASGPRDCDVAGTCDPYQPDPALVEEPAPTESAQATQPRNQRVVAATTNAVVPEREPDAAPAAETAPEEPTFQPASYEPVQAEEPAAPVTEPPSVIEVFLALAAATADLVV